MDIALEQEILKGLHNSDSKSFDMLFRQYHPKVYCFILGFIKNEADASDLAQELS